MTPPELDVDLVHARLRLMRELLDDLRSVGESVPRAVNGFGRYIGVVAEALRGHTDRT